MAVARHNPIDCVKMFVAIKRWWRWLVNFSVSFGFMVFFLVGPVYWPHGQLDKRCYVARNRSAVCFVLAHLAALRFSELALFVKIMKYLKNDPIFFRGFRFFFHCSRGCKWLPLLKFACSVIQLLWQTFCLACFPSLLTFASFLWIVNLNVAIDHVSNG